MAIGIAVLLTVGQIDACRAGDGMAGTGDGASVFACISDTTASQVQPQGAIAMLLHLKAWVSQLAMGTRPSDHSGLQPKPSHRYHTHHLRWLSRTHGDIPHWCYYSDWRLRGSWNTPTRSFLSVLDVVVLSVWMVWVDERDCHLPAG